MLYKNEQGALVVTHFVLDTDECATNAHKCPAPAMCQNTDGAYDCICPEGYQMIDNVCVDLDECK